MATSLPGEITKLLLEWGQGDEPAREKLISLVYDELHLRAKRFMGREQPGHTLQPTALINEAYLRLIDSTQVSWKNRNDFYAVCANLMRQILVDFARSRGSQKRGGGVNQVSLDEALVISYEKSAELIALDEALKSLAAIDPRKSRIVELRYFGGLSVAETAEVLKVSPDTVMRDWGLAKVWLYRQLSGKEK